MTQRVVKINVDGACKNGVIAAAAIARDDKGAFLGCITKAEEYGNPIMAEGLACTLAIDLIHRLNLNQVLIESDSKILIDNINGNLAISNWRISSSVKACRRLISVRNDIAFHFAPRSTNKVAHALATHAITFDVNQFWNGGLPPPFLLDLLFSDLASAVTHPDD